MGVVLAFTVIASLVLVATIIGVIGVAFLASRRRPELDDQRRLDSYRRRTLIWMLHLRSTSAH